MTGDKVFNLLGSLLTIATITVILSSERFTAILWEIGLTFRRMLREAMGANL